MVVGRAMKKFERHWLGVPILRHCVQYAYLEPGIFITDVSSIRSEGASVFNVQHIMWHVCAYVYGIVHTNSTDPQLIIYYFVEYRHTSLQYVRRVRHAVDTRHPRRWMHHINRSLKAPCCHLQLTADAKTKACTTINSSSTVWDRC